MLLEGQRFSNLILAKRSAQEVANEMECNVPIYYAAPFYYHWIGDELVEWVKPVIENDDGY
tara:strand:- start:4219 stop:4401 length:183 start_codon:yes stop_codon:yes gene_type:complete